MGSISLSPSPQRHRHHHHHHHHSAIPRFSFPSPFLHFPPSPFSLALKAISGGGGGLGSPQESAPPRAPVALSGADIFQEEEEKVESGGDGNKDEWKRRRTRAKLRRTRDRWDPSWAYWENCILEDTVPVVGFARMLLQIGKYKNGERLSPEHENIVVERLLTHHPAYEEKIGCGIDYITVEKLVWELYLCTPVCLHAFYERLLSGGKLPYQNQISLRYLDFKVQKL